MARSKPSIEETVKKREPTLAERTQKLDKLFEDMTAKSGILGGRPTVNPAVRDRMTFKFYPTPLPEFNEITGGGIPAGHMCMFVGTPDSSKTGLALSIVAYNQKLDPDFIALWVESEDSIDINQVEAVYHIDLSRFYCISTTDPETKKQVFGAEAIGDAIINAVQTTKINMVVINSLKMLVPMVEIKKQFEDDTMAVQARFNAKLAKKVVPLFAQKGTSMILIQHYTTDLNSYGNPNKPAGGQAIQYNSLFIAEFSKVRLEDSDPVTKETGLKFHVRFGRNHCVFDRNPYRDFYYCIEYGKGIERYITTLKALISQGILVQKGAWIYLLNEDGSKNPDMSWMGKNAFKADMLEHPEKFDTLCSMLDVGSGIHDMTEEEALEIQRRVGVELSANVEEGEISGESANDTENA